MFTIKLQRISFILNGKERTQIGFTIHPEEQPELCFKDLPQNGESMNSQIEYPNGSVNPYVGNVLFQEQEGKKVFHLENAKPAEIFFFTECKFQEK